MYKRTRRPRSVKNAILADKIYKLDKDKKGFTMNNDKINTTELLKKLISIPSPYFYEEEIAVFLEKKLQEMGFKTGRQEVKRAGFVNGELKNFTHFNVLGEKGEGERSFLLYAHMDTVPVVKEWADLGLDPFTPVEKDGKIIGLGSDDMKAGIVIILKAVEDLEHEGYKIKVVFGVDEEYLSTGAHVLVNSPFFEDVKGCIVPEVGSGDSEQKVGNLVLGRHGRCRFGVSIKGRAAHAATPEFAINPIKYALELIEDVEKISLGEDTDMPKGNVSTASISSEIGGLSNPEECVLWFDFLYSPSMLSDKILDQLNEIIGKRNKMYATDKVNSEGKTEALPSFRVIDPRDMTEEDKARFDSRPTPFQEPFKLEKDSKLFKAAAKSVKEITGNDPTVCYGKSNADENYFSQKAPTLVLPPVGGNEHQGGEFIEIDSMDKVAMMMKRTVENFFEV